MLRLVHSFKLKIKKEVKAACKKRDGAMQEIQLTQLYLESQGQEIILSIKIISSVQEVEGVYNS